MYWYFDSLYCGIPTALDSGSSSRESPLENLPTGSWYLAEFFVLARLSRLKNRERGNILVSTSNLYRDPKRRTAFVHSTNTLQTVLSLIYPLLPQPLLPPTSKLHRGDPQTRLNTTTASSLKNTNTTIAQPFSFALCLQIHQLPPIIAFVYGQDNFQPSPPVISRAWADAAVAVVASG